MEVIINMANKKNSYAKKFNGKTFNVHSILSNGVSVLGMNEQYPQNQTDFSFEEILIVNIEKEYQKAKEIGDFNLINKLNKYILLRGINMDTI